MKGRDAGELSRWMRPRRASRTRTKRLGVALAMTALMVPVTPAGAANQRELGGGGPTTMFGGGSRSGPPAIDNDRGVASAFTKGGCPAYERRGKPRCR